ncbi:hypothetical protein LUH44_43115, partial [Bradyrhizobium diazoefficiens]|nr:hypothetical protein [Bradyrhizobium diazoefficiens]
MFVDYAHKPDALEPALGAFEMFEAREYVGGIAAGADREAGRHQRILDLEFAGQRQQDHITLAAMLDRELLRKAVDPDLGEANALAHPVAVAADRHHA